MGINRACRRQYNFRVVCAIARLLVSRSRNTILRRRHPFYGRSDNESAVIVAAITGLS